MPSSIFGDFDEGGETSTARTFLAPSAFTASTGTGDIAPPSTRSMPSCSTGGNMPGIELLANTARLTEPSVKITRLPVVRSKLTTARGIVESDMSASGMSVFIKSLNISPFRMLVRSARWEQR